MHYCIHLKPNHTSPGDCEKMAEWLQMLENGWSPLAPLFKSTIVFLQCRFFMSITRARSCFFYKTFIILYISRCTVVFSLPSHAHRNILEEFWYPVHAVALLRLLLTEVPSCPPPFLPSTLCWLSFRVDLLTCPCPDSDMCSAPDTI